MTITELKTKVVESSIASIVGAIVGAVAATLLWLFSDIPSALYYLLQNLQATGYVTNEFSTPCASKQD
jgi:hypothetical protein